MKNEPIIEPQNIISSGVKAFFTTRAFNSIEDAPGELNYDIDNVYLPIQKHTNAVHVLNSDMTQVIADAVVTDRKGILIGVQVADCVPVLLYDRQRSVIGAVHAGWRGTAKLILKNAIITMQERFNSSAEDILIAMGPSIRQCCYEAGADVKEAVAEATGENSCCQVKNGKYFIDLLSANRYQAVSMGIPADNIWQSDDCTFCNPELFYSYRYAKGTTGRQGGFIGMW
ncbi:MAG: peptidoglycan editing factor PgeF [Nitrospirae bacterium]|nr:peptidoglycan editing factor PgeF [Nitrospirota bacterium]